MTDKKKKVLVIEDDTHLLEYLTQNLSDDYNIKGLEGGLHAFETIEEFQPDVMLVDYLLPEMDGLSICKEAVRKVPPAIMPKENYPTDRSRTTSGEGTPPRR